MNGVVIMFLYLVYKPGEVHDEPNGLGRVNEHIPERWG